MQTQQGVDAQFAFTNSLGIRADFNRGPLTNEQMYNVFPFENTIVVLYMSGNEVQDTLDFVAQESSQRGCRSQLQQAGLTWDMVCRDDPTGPTPCTSIDPAAPDTVCAVDTDCPSGDRCDTSQSRCVTRACAQNIYIGDGCRPADPNTGQINPDVPVDPATTKCTPLSLDGLYRVAVNNYIAAGGSGFLVLQRNTSQQDTGVSLRDSLTVFLTQQGNKCDGVTTSQILDFTDTEMTTACKIGADCPSHSARAGSARRAPSSSAGATSRASTRRSRRTTVGSGRCSSEPAGAARARIHIRLHDDEPGAGVDAAEDHDRLAVERRRYQQPAAGLRFRQPGDDQRPGVRREQPARRWPDGPRRLQRIAGGVHALPRHAHALPDRLAAHDDPDGPRRRDEPVVHAAAGVRPDDDLARRRHVGRSRVHRRNVGRRCGTAIRSPPTCSARPTRRRSTRSTTSRSTARTSRSPARSSARTADWSSRRCTRRATRSPTCSARTRTVRRRARRPTTATWTSSRTAPRKISAVVTSSKDR